MNSLWLLLKVQLLSLFNINKLKQSKNKKERYKYLIFLLITTISLALFAILSYTYSYLMADSLDSLNMLRLLPCVMFTASCIIVLFTAILKTNGIIFGYKDYDMIMSLPVKSSTVIASRLILLYLMNITFVFIIMIPMAIVYATRVHPQAYFYLYFILSVFFIPFIPITIATIIGSIIVFISIKLRYTNFLNIILSLIFIIGIYAASSQLNNITIDVSPIYQSLMEMLYTIYPVTKLFIEAICDYNFISFLLFVLITVAIFILYTILLSKSYNHINNALTSKRTNSNYQLKTMKENRVLVSLFIKEMKRYFSSPLYVLNTGIGGVLLIVLSIAMFFFQQNQLDQMLEMPGFTDLIQKVAPLVSTAFVATICTTSSSISLEGNKLWILKSSPIPIMDIFYSKILVNVMTAFPGILISTVLLSIRLQFDFIYIISLFLLPLVYSFLIGVLGLIINLHFPKLEWTSEAQVIKQSASAMLSPLAGIALIALPILAVIKIPSAKPDFVIFATILISILIIGLLYAYLKKFGQKLFDQL